MATRALAGGLRRDRTAANKTLEAAATKLEFSVATMSRIENALKIPKARDIRELGQLYELHEAELERLLELHKQATDGTGVADLFRGDEAALVMDMEMSAEHISQFAAEFIPSVLQTPDYARVLIEELALRSSAPGASHEDWLRTRQERQERLRGQDGPEQTVIMDEAVLHRNVGKPAVMREQLDHLAEIIWNGKLFPKLSLRVLPLNDGIHSRRAGSFIIFDFKTPDLPNAVYIETLMGELILEKGDELARYSVAFNEIADHALSKDDSAETVKRLKKQYNSQD